MKLKNIKDSFDKREIQPSDGAWDQLASRLDEQKKASSRKPFIYWISAVAAVLILGWLVFPFFSNQMESVAPHDEMIVQQEKTDTLSKETTTQEIVVSENEDAGIDNEPVITNSQRSDMATTVRDESAEFRNDKEANKVLVVKKSRSNSKTMAADIAGITDVQEENRDQPLLKTTKTDDSIIGANKVENAVVENNSQLKKTLTAEEEADLLLTQALKTVSYTEIEVKEINVNQLLRETEWDIEADRRNKVNDAIFDGLGKLKSEAFALIGGK